MNSHSSKLTTNMNARSLRLFAFLVLALPFAAAQSTVPATPPRAAANATVKGPAKPYPLKICLVTDSDLDSMGDEVTFVHQGQTIKICCKPCERKFLRAPEKYLAKLAALLEAAKK